ncbi:hypothetical protein RND81_10G146200 [Saponaria officinalis]|uniref:Uncharacterized protein n=1 Tax=Saponaria officinalis TaxID=3572 RepID=A0AAW1I228_SAPOF
MMTLSVGTATADLVLFNKEAEKVVGKPIEKLLDVYEKVYEILQQCVGKKYMFKVKVGESKYNGERELKDRKTLPYPNQATETNTNAKDKKQLQETTHQSSEITPEEKGKRKNTEAGKEIKDDEGQENLNTRQKKRRSDNN